MAPEGSTLVVFSGQHRTLLFPDCVIAIPDDVALHDIRIDERNGPNGPVWRPVFPNH